MLVENSSDLLVWKKFRRIKHQGKNNPPGPGHDNAHYESLTSEQVSQSVKLHTHRLPHYTG